MVKLGFEVNNNFPHQLDMFKAHSTPRPNYKDVLTPYLVEIVNENTLKILKYLVMICYLPWISNNSFVYL
jgi:hypothetical protein